MEVRKIIKVRLDYWLKTLIVIMVKLSNQRKSKITGHEKGCIEIGLRVIRFHRKLELLTVILGNRNVGLDE